MIRCIKCGFVSEYLGATCPKCKEKDPAVIFAEDVNKLHSYLAERGLKMMIWSDMIQPVTMSV